MDAYATQVIGGHRVGDGMSVAVQRNPFCTHFFVMGVYLTKDMRLRQYASYCDGEGFPQIDGIVHSRPQLLIGTAFRTLLTINMRVIF